MTNTQATLIYKLLQDERCYNDYHMEEPEIVAEEIAEILGLDANKAMEYTQVQAIITVACSHWQEIPAKGFYS